MFQEQPSAASVGSALAKDSSTVPSENACVRSASNQSGYRSGVSSNLTLSPSRRVSFLDDAVNFEVLAMAEPTHAAPRLFPLIDHNLSLDSHTDVAEENSSKSKFQSLLSEIECEHNRKVEELKQELERFSRVFTDSDEFSLPRSGLPRELHNSESCNLEDTRVRRDRSSDSDSVQVHLTLKDTWANPPKYSFLASETLEAMDTQLSVDVRQMVPGFDAKKDGGFQWRASKGTALSRGSYDSARSKATGESQQDVFDPERQLNTRTQQLAVYRRENGFIVNPVRPFRVCWDLTGLALIAWDCVTIPVALSFDPEMGGLMIAISWICTIFWSTDMVLSLFTGYFVKGDLVMDWCKILKNYFTGWFWLDVATVAPDWILKMSSGGENNAAGMGRIMRIGRIARVLRLLRILKLKKIINLIYDMIDTEHMFIWVSLVKMIVAIFCLNHMVACGWFLVGKTSKEQDLGKNWLDDVGVTRTRVDSSFEWRYLTSLHWAITQFTPASMDIFATNVPERIYSVAVLFWSLVVLSSLIGNVSSAMTSLRNMSNEDHKHFWLLRRYMKQEGVSKDLQIRIVKYLEHQAAQHHNQISKSRVNLLGQIPTALSYELANEQFSKVFELHPFFSHLQQEIPKVMYRMCATAVKILFHATLEKVYEFGEECFSVFFLKSGKYEYNVVSNVKIVRSKAWSSEMVLWCAWRHRGNLTAAKPASTLAVNPQVFSEIMRIHPRPWQFASKYGAQILRHLNSIPNYSLTDLTYNHDTWEHAVLTSDPQSALYLDGSLDDSTMSPAGQKKSNVSMDYSIADSASSA